MLTPRSCHFTRSEFVEAVRSADLATVVELLHRASGVDAVVRLRPEGLPVTALHVAASEGRHAIMEVLLSARADASAKMPTLRALTPLHMCKSADTCRLLLDAGAPPIALDPRQPDPSTHLRIQGYADAADAVVRWRAQRLPFSARQQLLGGRTLPPLQGSATSSGPSGSGADGAGGSVARSPKRAVVPAMSCAELKLARAAWYLRPDSAAHKAVLAALADEDECVVCMSSLSGRSMSPWLKGTKSVRRTSVCLTACAPIDDDDDDDDDGIPAPAIVEEPPRPPLLLLPCGHAGARPHCLHAACAERWLLRRASCPICRRDVRPQLPSPRAPPPPLTQRPPGPRPLTTTGSGRHRATSPRATSPRAASPRASSPRAPALRPASPRVDTPREPSPREKRASLNDSSISMRELATKLPANRAVGVNGKIWVGWRAHWEARMR
jgi:hypothetical protein